MKVIYACDNGYFRYTYISIMSLLEHNESNENIELVFIEQDVKKENLDKLSSLCKKFNREINIIPFSMPKEFESLPSVGDSKTTFVKFLFSSLFPNDDKVVFFDPDTLILNDLEELFEINLDGFMFGGVIENLPKYHRVAAGMNDEQSYINGGMVLCNLKLWREVSFEKQVLQYMVSHEIKNNFDQGILNELCRGQIKIIHPKFNVLAEIFELKKAKKIMKRYGFKNYYSQEEIDEALNKPTIVHFTKFLYGKPFNIDCKHPLMPIFDKYLDESGLDKTKKGKCTTKMKIRRFVLHYTPFFIYLLFERILDIRRKKFLYYAE